MSEHKEAQEPKRSLVKKLAEVMGEVERVAKNGRNTSQGYDYATEADIAAAVRGGLSRRSLMMVPSVEKMEWSSLATKSGGSLRLCTLTVKFTLEDGDSGETRSLIAVGEGTDSGDKASYKAMTGAEKYALMKLFLIPTGDDPEKDEAPPPAPGAQTPQTAHKPVQRELTEGERLAAEEPQHTAGPEPEDLSGGLYGPVLDWPDKFKGMRASQLTIDNLNWLVKQKRRTLDDPAKKKFHAKEQRTLDELVHVLRTKSGPHTEHDA